MDTLRRALKARQDGIRRVLGFGFLLLTVIGAYTASRIGGANSQPQPAVPTIDAYIKEAASEYAVPERLVMAVIEVESEFNPNAVSHRGAQGLMQLMPATAASLGVRDAFDPRDNIQGGVRHLAWLLDRFDRDLPTVLAAYNAGETAVTKNRRMPRETRAYVKRVLERMTRDDARS